MIPGSQSNSTGFIYNVLAPGFAILSNASVMMPHLHMNELQTTHCTLMFFKDGATHKLPM